MTKALVIRTTVTATTTTTTTTTTKINAKTKAKLVATELQATSVNNNGDINQLVIG